MATSKIMFATTKFHAKIWLSTRTLQEHCKMHHVCKNYKVLPNWFSRNIMARAWQDPCLQTTIQCKVISFKPQRSNARRTRRWLWKDTMYWSFSSVHSLVFINWIKTGRLCCLYIIFMVRLNHMLLIIGNIHSCKKKSEIFTQPYKIKHNPNLLITVISNLNCDDILPWVFSGFGVW